MQAPRSGGQDKRRYVNRSGQVRILMQRLLNVSIVFALALSYAGGALSASPCPHGCHAPHASRFQSHNRGSSPQQPWHCHALANQEADDSSEAFGGEIVVAPKALGVVQRPAQLPGAHGSAFATCDHCVGRGEAPSPFFTERTSAQSQKDAGADAPANAARLERALAAFVKEIVPYEDGPPSPIHRHVLISVFRI